MLAAVVRVMAAGDATVRDHCEEVLVAVGEDAIPTVRELATHEDEDLRQRARLWLDEIGAD